MPTSDASEVVRPDRCGKPLRLAPVRTRSAFAGDYVYHRVEKKVYTHNGTSWDLSTTRRFVYYNWLPLLELDVTNPGDPNEAFTYDEDGNLTADGSFTYEWDAENRLSRVWLVDPTPGQDEEGDRRVDFVYDYMGRRLRKVVEEHNGSAWVKELDRRFVYYNWLLLLELDGLNGNAIVRKYTWGLDLAGQSGGPASGRSIEDAAGTLDRHPARQGRIGGLLATYDADSSKSYIYLYDANGNVGQLVDLADGSTDAKYEYDAYGNNLLDPSDPNDSGPYADDNPFRFSTKYFDGEVDCAATTNHGLYYFGYRYYSPRFGRWPNPDPFGEPPGGVNLYAYVRNDAITVVDPLGGCEGKSDCQYCCCAEELTAEVVAELTSRGQWGNWGHSIDVTGTVLFKIWEKDYKGWCKVDWWEWDSYGKQTIGPLTPRTWTDRSGEPGLVSINKQLSPTLQANQCNKEYSGTKNDEPVLSVGDPANYDVERNLYIAVRLSSAEGCPCDGQSSVEVHMHQYLRIESGVGVDRPQIKIQRQPFDPPGPPPWN